MGLATLRAGEVPAEESETTYHSFTRGTTEGDLPIMNDR